MTNPFDDLFGDLKENANRWLKSRQLNKITDSVSNQLQEARQKLLVSESPLKVIARACIDDAEDAYQEAIYCLKDGSTREAIEYCKKSAGFLSLAFLHLRPDQKILAEPEFKPGETADVVLNLARSISRFKTLIEYTNCELGKDEHDQYLDVVRLFYKSVDCFASNEDETSRRIAITGMLWMFLLNSEMKATTGSTGPEASYLKEHGNVEAERIVDLISITCDARQAFEEASEPAQLRTNQYLTAARNTIENCINKFMEGHSVAKLAKAGKMEVRMARRLIDSSFSLDEEGEAEVKEQEDNRIFEFKRRIAHLQQIIQENDPEALKTIRRLHQVGSYYGMAVKLKENGSSKEAERYARSAHLDIDYARQLFSKGIAHFSDTI